MSEQRSSLEPFCLAPAESVGPRWERWVARFENYLVAANITAEARKKAQLLHLAGEDVFDCFLLCQLRLPPTRTQRLRCLRTSTHSETKSLKFSVFGPQGKRRRRQSTSSRSGFGDLQNTVSLVT